MLEPGEVADGLVAPAEQQPEHGHLAEAQVVVGVPLAGQAAAQAHHSDAELCGEPRVGAGNGCCGRHVVSITHYPC